MPKEGNYTVQLIISTNKLHEKMCVGEETQIYHPSSLSILKLLEIDSGVKDQNLTKLNQKTRSESVIK